MNEITPAERDLINKFKQSQKWTCYYCHKNICHKDDLTVDHKIPLSRGGLTVEANLAICCLKCNNEKDNLTEEEYQQFKQKQDQLRESMEYTALVDNLFELYDQIIQSANNVYSDYTKSEKQIQVIEEQILSSTFNAYQGYLLAKELKEALLNRNRLKLAKEAYNNLHTLVANNKKQLTVVNEKIDKSLMESQYNLLKESCKTEKQNEDEKKVIDISSVKTVNE